MRPNFVNLVSSIALVVATAIITDWWVWHPNTFSGWSLLGFGLLAIGAIVAGLLIFLSLRGEARWAVAPAFILGLMVGIGGFWFYQTVDVRWQDALIGFLIFAIIGGLIGVITYTRWQPHSNALRNRVGTPRTAPLRTTP